MGTAAVWAHHISPNCWNDQDNELKTKDPISGRIIECPDIMRRAGVVAGVPLALWGVFSVVNKINPPLHKDDHLERTATYKPQANIMKNTKEAIPDKVDPYAHYNYNPHMHYLYNPHMHYHYNPHA